MKNNSKLIKSISLNELSSMKDAIIILESFIGLVLVTNENGELIGTITDGDIRRALIKHYPMSKELLYFMNKSPKTGNINYSEKDIYDLMEKFGISQIPIIDENNHVINIKLKNEINTDQKYNNPVLLMAGGFGKRLHPLTNNTPKPLIKIGEKPILQLILENLIDHGFRNFFISTHFLADQVSDYFGDGSAFNVSIRYVHEDKPLGTAGALGLMPDNISKLPLIMMNADLLTKVNFNELVNFHIKNSKNITMCVRKYDIQVPYGVVESDGHIVKEIVEKPLKSFFVNAGVYVVDHSVTKNVDGSHKDMPDLIKELLDIGKETNIFPMHEYWLDIGQLENLEQAKADILENKN